MASRARPTTQHSGTIDLGAGDLLAVAVEFVKVDSETTTQIELRDPKIESITYEATKAGVVETVVVGFVDSCISPLRGG